MDFFHSPVIVEITPERLLHSRCAPYAPGMGAMMVWSAGAGPWDGAGEGPTGPLLPPGAGPAGWASVGCTAGTGAVVEGTGAEDGMVCWPELPGPLKEELVPEVSEGWLVPGPAGPAGAGPLSP